ncbi:phosphoglycolate phosphatase-like HAD superfamily hydrolase [Actinocorallia herbida]|uniref:Phosphoglycolate phosphatase-like HAD superfamily hydrolase n=1 Tax=Actinocorallia herbida TaxID=58109 RepID=A0A3N1D497_9ACTN|nr:phosphoglycolate phosphatase-like HAD superfamily hydrolase [Actinocorallia herbida]
MWDWNGTLFDDLDIVLGASAAAFLGTEAEGISGHEIRAAYTRPIWVAYEKLLGRPLREGEWERMDEAFHVSYEQLLPAAPLTADALTALDHVTGAGRSQSILSMARHDQLTGLVEGFGITRYFTRVDGLVGAPGGGKAEHLVRHAAALGIAPADLTVIGDAADDALAAAHIGAQAVLYTGGMQRRTELESTGAPVVDTLLTALTLAGL